MPVETTDQFLGTESATERVARTARNTGEEHNEETVRRKFPVATTEADLRRWFSAHGLVESVTLITDRDAGRSRGFGFVEMPNASEADAAITHLNGKDAGGRMLTVNEARPKSQRRATGFGGRNNSRRDDYVAMHLNRGSLAGSSIVQL